MGKNKMLIRGKQKVYMVDRFRSGWSYQRQRVHVRGKFLWIIPCWVPVYDHRDWWFPVWNDYIPKDRLKEMYKNAVSSYEYYIESWEK